MGVPSLFKSTLYALVTAILASFEEPLGAGEWGRRYAALLSQSPIDPIPVVLPRSPAARGVYANNAILQNLTKLGEGSVLQPEDVVVDPSGEFLYVTSMDGWVKKLWLATGAVHNWTYVGGRPLGIALDRVGDVVVCEPIQGLLIKINKETGSKSILSSEAEGVKFGLIDEVTVATNGLIYFTDASSKYNYSIWWYDIFESRPHRRLLIYNPHTNTTTILLRNLSFANGLTISKSEDHLIFCETTLARCSKYSFKERKVDVFIDNLPGLPDNIHQDDAGDRYYIAVLTNRNALTDFVSKTNVLKHLLAWNINFYRLYDSSPHIGRFLEVDAASGKVIRTYEDPTGAVIGALTTAVPHGDFMYVGGLRDNFVGRIEKVQ